MSDEQISEFSPGLRAFFGFLKYEKTDRLAEFVATNSDSFSNMTDDILNALAELTHSPELEQFRLPQHTETGGVDMVYGIEVYAQKVAKEESKKTYVETAKYFGQSISDTLKGFIDRFNVTQDEAERYVEKYWNEQIG